MSGHYVHRPRSADHCACDLPLPDGRDEHGTVWQCDDCGKRWTLVDYSYGGVRRHRWVQIQWGQHA